MLLCVTNEISKLERSIYIYVDLLSPLAASESSRRSTVRHRIRLWCCCSKSRYRCLTYNKCEDAQKSHRNQMSYQKTKMDHSQSGHIHVASRDFEPTSDSWTGQQPDVPLAVVEEILLNLPERQVVRVCRLVCREWKELVDSAAHWRERCRREGIQPCDASRLPEDWRLFYFLSRRRRNLIKNPRAEDKFNGWKLVENGGDCWSVEDNSVEIPNNTVPKYFVTSYWLCLKQQLINLKKEGYSAAFMDQLQPHIKISDWYAPRCDCGSEYQICVELLDQKKKPISTFKPEKVFFPQWNNQQWCEMTHVFKDYGPGVRFIRFTHGGKDTQFWKGWYGIRVTNSSVEICPAMVRVHLI